MVAVILLSAACYILFGGRLMELVSDPEALRETFAGFGIFGTVFDDVESQRDDFVQLLHRQVGGVYKVPHVSVSILVVLLMDYVGLYR